MTEDKMMPEERLLKIIENPMSAKSAGSVALNKPVDGAPRNILALAKRFNIGVDFFKRLGLRRINIIVAAVAVIVTLVWLIDFFTMNRALKVRESKIKPAADDSAKEVDSSKAAKMPTHEMIAAAKKRNIFTSSPTVPEAVMLQDSQAIADLKLVGIIWSDNPQAMIEDTKGQKTYLLSTGDKIGKFKVKQILRDKAIIAGDDWEKELR